MRKNKYKFTKIFFILGFTLALITFFNSSSLISYGKSTLIFTLVLGSVGLMIDKFILKKPIIPIVLIILYILIGGLYLNYETTEMHCLACNFAPYENIFTGECGTFCDICGNSPPWYWEKSKTCIAHIPLQ